MGKLLDEAKRNPTKQNQKMKERLKELEEEVDDIEVTGEEWLELLTTFDKDPDKEPLTEEIMLRKKIKLTVYLELSGEQQDLLGRINRVHRDSKRKGKKFIPDIKDAMDSAVELCASLIVPEEGREWHKEEVWRAMLKATTFEDIMEALTELLQPYEDYRKKISKFP